MRVHYGTALAVAWLALVLCLTLAAPWLIDGSPLQPVGEPLRLPGQHPPLGTDDLGRDIWSRLLYGGRTSLASALAGAGLAVGLGTLAAFAAQSLGGAADATLLGGTSTVMAIPGLLLALLLVAVIGPGLDAVTLAVGLGLAPGYARLARQALRDVRSATFVAASHALGASRLQTTRLHLLPNALPRLLSLATTHFAWAIAGVTTLAFLGLSGDPSRPDWGTMLSAGRTYLRIAPTLGLLPGGAIAATVLAVHAVGEAVARRARSPGRG